MSDVDKTTKTGEESKATDLSTADAGTSTEAIPELTEEVPEFAAEPETIRIFDAAGRSSRDTLRLLKTFMQWQRASVLLSEELVDKIIADQG